MAPKFRYIDTASAGGTGAENEIEAAKNIVFSIDLVAAAKKQLQFLKAVGNMPCLHHGPVVLEAIRRYKQFWMPLAAELGHSHTLLPPLDVQWVWHCHCLNPDSYRRYCFSRFGRIIDKPLFLESNSEADSLERCRKIWTERFPSEPFELRVKPRLGSDSGAVHPVNVSSESSAEDDDFDLVAAISTQASLYQQQVFQPYMWEYAFLVAATERFKCFLYLVKKYSEIFTTFVPTFDVILIWTAYQNSPVAYTKDMEWVDRVTGGTAIARGPNNMSEEDLHETARLWENTYRNPYQKAGALFESILSTPLPISKALGGLNNPKPMYWENQETDVNRNRETLEPRYVMEVSILIKGVANAESKEEFKHLFLRLRALNSYKRLKSEKSLAKLSNGNRWQKPWTLQCELSTRGLLLELRSSMNLSCISPLGKSKRLDKLGFLWIEMLQAPSLTIDKTITVKSNISTPNSSTDHQPLIRIIASITPPIQAPYLLKCVPDLVTDDSGAMLSDYIVRMNKNRPQEGRWISRTVFNHAWKECFVVRIRVARGTWKKRRGDGPVGVDWNERIIQICEGSWKYVYGSIGITPEKVVGTATPIADDLENHKMTWSLSSGEIFTIQMPIQQIKWERHLEFTLKNTPKGKSARLLNGRKLEYQVTGAKSEEEEGFVTLVRYTAQCPQGKATALFNWKVSAMEFLPEEDAVLILLLCEATFRTVVDFGADNLGNLFIRRRMKQAKPGSRDWGSVVIQNSPSMPDLNFWYLNPREVLGLPPVDERPTLNSEEETHVYRNGSWLYKNTAAASTNRAYYKNSEIHKAGSSGNAFKIGVAEEGGVESSWRSFSGFPAERHRRKSSSDSHSKKN